METLEKQGSSNITLEIMHAELVKGIDLMK